MCGIAGIVDWSGAAVELRLLQAMTDTLTHRGPDGEGHHRALNVGLGHRRLSIIDIETGQQPMCNEDGSVWATFNGEIYNFLELRRELSACGHIFRTRSDTEVIVHGYEQWGAGVVARLRGMFAFAVLDQRSGHLLLARDHFGVKPLVFYQGERRFLFASEIKAFGADPEFRRDLDPDAVADYFECGYIPAPRTIYRHTSKLLPGHYVLLNVAKRGPVDQRCYWRLSYQNEPGKVDEREAIEQIDALLRESVEGQMISDVPLGALLSGGIDSSTIVEVMARLSPDQIKTFSIGFQEQSFNETRFARMVAEQVRSDHHEFTVSAEIESLLPRLVYHFDEPFADASAIPTYYVCEMARRHVTVCLSGDGGDEIFGGYERYRQCLSYARLDWIPLQLRRLMFGGLVRLYPGGLPGAALLDGIARTPEDRFLGYLRRQYGQLALPGMLNSAVANGASQRQPDLQCFRNAFNPLTLDPLHKYMEVDVATYLPNDVLAKTDITSMMNSLEVRVPLLDHRLAEYVAKLPPDFKLRGGVTKYILRKGLADRLPAAVLSRGKMGFGVPIRQWAGTRLRDTVRHYLLNPSRVSGLLDAAMLRRMVEENERDPRGSALGGKIWWMLFFEMWFQDVYRRDPLQRATPFTRAVNS